MSRTDYDLIVVGAGSGGLTAAIGGAQIGAKTLLVEKEKIGGDCTHYGCVPSKTLIKASRVAQNFKEAGKFGLKIDGAGQAKFSVEDALKKVGKTVQKIYNEEKPDKLKKFGLETVIGEAQFVSKNSIQVGDKKYSAKKFVIATGSRARLPQIPGLEKIRYMTNKEIFVPRDMKSLIVVGGGPIGIELSGAFAGLGVKVKVVQRSGRILDKEEKKASRLVQKKLEERGAEIFLNQDVMKVGKNGKKKVVFLKNNKNGKTKKIEADEILFSIGRVPNIEDLGLEKAGVEADERGIFINDKTQTSNRKIYAIGDVARVPQFTHYANHMGKVALANLIFKFPAKIEKQVLPRVTFSSPEIASVGVNEDSASKEFLILKKKYSEIDRAVTDSETEGYFSIIVDKKGFIQGATLVGEGAGELIGEIALAMKNKIKITQLADTIHPYPTYGYGLRNTADQFRSLNFSQNKKSFLKMILRLRGK